MLLNITERLFGDEGGNGEARQIIWWTQKRAHWIKVYMFSLPPWWHLAIRHNAPPSSLCRPPNCTVRERAIDKIEMRWMRRNRRPCDGSIWRSIRPILTKCLMRTLPGASTELRFMCKCLYTYICSIYCLYICILQHFDCYAPML